MLDVDNVLPFLIDQGLVQTDWIPEGELTIRSVARRNRNLMIEGPDGQGFVIKQPDTFAEKAQETLSSEARFYDFCHQEEAAQVLLRWLPPLTLRDLDNGLLVLGLIPGARALHVHQLARRTDAGLITGFNKSLGRALGTLHRLFRRPGLADDQGLSWLKVPLPWVFQAHRPALSVLTDLSGAAASVLRIIQSSTDLRSLLDSLPAQWRCETVIHGDIKSENVLVSDRVDEDAADDEAIWLIDWEFVQLGDPAWDLAGALHDAVVLWTCSMPLEPALKPEQMAAGARVPLEAIRETTRALCRGYVESSGMDRSSPSEASGSLFRRAVAFSVARLIQAAVEQARERDELPVQAVLLLQIAANLAADPQRVALTLYGINLEAGLP
jgi:hypothetical protein